MNTTTIGAAVAASNDQHGTDQAAATPAPALLKWTPSATLGPIMLGKVNKALKAVSWNARGVCDLTGILEKPETHQKSTFVMVAIYGGNFHPEYTAKMVAIQAKHGAAITPDNYRGLINDLNELATWFGKNPMIHDKRITQAAHDEAEASMEKFRVEQAERDRARRDQEAARLAETGRNNKAQVSENAAKDGVELRFPAKPEESVISRMKAFGFRWAFSSKCWYARRNARTLDFAYALAGKPRTLVTTAEPTETVRDPGEDAADRHSEAMGAEEVTERLMEMEAWTR